VDIVSRGDLVSLMATEWASDVCGEPVRGERAPDVCPKCLGSGYPARDWIAVSASV
jgi:rubrerythrin